MNDDKKESPEKTTNLETKKQNQDFPNIPAANEKQNPPDIKKEDIKESSNLAETGKTDNDETGEN